MLRPVRTGIATHDQPAPAQPQVPLGKSVKATLRDLVSVNVAFTDLPLARAPVELKDAFAGSNAVKDAFSASSALKASFSSAGVTGG